MSQHIGRCYQIMLTRMAANGPCWPPCRRSSELMRAVPAQSTHLQRLHQRLHLQRDSRTVFCFLAVVAVERIHVGKGKGVDRTTPDSITSERSAPCVLYTHKPATKKTASADTRAMSSKSTIDMSSTAREEVPRLRLAAEKSTIGQDDDT